MFDWAKYTIVTPQLGPYLTMDASNKFNNYPILSSPKHYLYLVKKYNPISNLVSRLDHDIDMYQAIANILNNYPTLHSWTDFNYWADEFYEYYFSLFTMPNMENTLPSFGKIYDYNVCDVYDCISRVPYDSIESNQSNLIPNTTNKICNNCYMETIPLFHHDRFCPKCKI